VVAEFVATSRIAVTYSCESRQNISLARNEALKHAAGGFVAFIDDDEFPENGWLGAMLEACDKYQAAGVLGPVLPHFEKPPPRWIMDGRFFERPEHQTGRVMEWGGVPHRQPIVSTLDSGERSGGFQTRNAAWRKCSSTPSAEPAWLLDRSLLCRST
jgi:glycosyltransferase involved in cell wall biosynthesis